MMLSQSAAGREIDTRASHGAETDIYIQRHQHHRQLSNSSSHISHPDGPQPKKRRTRHLSPSPSAADAPDSRTRSSSKKIIVVRSPHDAIESIETSKKHHNFGYSIQHGLNGSPELPDRPTLAHRGVKDDGDKRLLRSQAGTSRVRSDLELFFTDYRELVFGPEKESNLLTVDSVFYITDDKPSAASSTLAIRVRDPNTSPMTSPTGSSRRRPNTSTVTHDSTTTTSAFQALDLSNFEDEARDFDEDPLSDDTYVQYHARGERRQKKERNIEKERSAHEKAQLQGLYDSLRGPDWLKTMGISGITDSEKKRFEPKRDECILRVKRMLAKFDDYKEQEKLLKIRRDRAAARAAARLEESDEEEQEEDEEDGQDEDDDDEEEERVDDGVNGGHKEGDSTSQGSSGLSLDESALQLQQEAGLSSNLPVKIKLRLSQAKRGDKPPSTPPSDLPFKSFFAKAHERAGALAKHRRGRHAAAFGHPLPDMPDYVEFKLPQGFPDDFQDSDVGED